MASLVVYFVRRGQLPISRFLLFASLTLWGCGPRAPAAGSSQQQSPQLVSQLQILARSPGVAIRLPAKGGTPQLYRLPRLTPVEGVLKGKLPPVERVIGLDPESEFLFVTTGKHDLLALDLGSGRVDTVGTNIKQAALGPDGTLYAVDSSRHVISLSRRTRFTWPQTLTALPRDLFGAADQHLVGVIQQDRLLVAAADQPPTVRPIAAGGDVAATRWGDLVAVASDSGVTFYDPLGRRDPAFVKLADAPRALAFSPSGHRIYVARRNMPGLAVLDRYERKELDGVALPGSVAALRLDPLGRWLLARPAVGDSAWIVDLPIKRHTGIVPTQWKSDLPAISPDGRLIACYLLDQQTRITKIALLPFEGGDPVKLFDLPQTAIRGEPVRWTPDGRDAFVGSVAVERNVDATNSTGVFILLRKYLRSLNSFDCTIVRRIVLISPSLVRYVCVMRSTRADGGSSATNRCASFQLIKCAVFGLAASAFSTFSPSL